MSNLILKYGSLATMPVAITNGTFRIATDVEKAFVDVNGIRVALGDVVTSYTASQITAITKANALPKIYMASDTFALYWFDTTAGEEDPETHEKPGAWKQVGANVSHATSADQDGDGNVITTTYETKSDATDKYNALIGQIAAINSFEVQVVETLPAEGQDHILYFVRHNSIVTDPDYNVFDEYMWVIKTPASGDDPAVYGWEHVGTTETDLTNYYTKTETDSIESAIYAALGITKNEAAASGFATFDSRLDALESTSGTDGGRIDELEAKFGAFNDSTAQGFTTVEERFAGIETNVSTAQSDITEINAKLGNMADSTSTGFQSVETRLTTLENDTADAVAVAEINAKLGNYPDSTATGFVSVADRFAANEGEVDEIQAQMGSYPASTDADFVSVADRFTTDETAISGAEGDIDELEAKFGNYATSTDAGFVSVEDRFTADETNISALQTEVGAASNPDAASLRGRMATAEADIDEVQAQLGNYPASTATGFVSVDDRLTALENDTTDATAVAEINAKLGNYPASTAEDFVSVADRFTANETSISGNASDIDEIQAQLGNYAASTDAGFVSVEDRFAAGEGEVDEIQAQLGNYPASTSTGFVSVVDRFTANESDISALQTEVGAASNPDAASLRGRMATAEADIDELEAKFGAYANSTDSEFVTVENRFAALESAVGNINRFDVQVIPDGSSLPVVGTQYTLYFVRHNSIPTDPDYNVFDEYMWVIKTPASGDDPAVYGYELVGTTETDLTNYYTKTEMDAVIGDASTSGTIIYRIKTNEDAIAEINAKLGNMADSTSTGFQSVEARLTTAETGIEELEAKFGSYATSTASGFVSAENRFVADESAIAEINAKLGNMADSTSTGFQSVEARLDAIEGGAVAQTEDDDDAEKPILVSGDANHSTVEYVPGVTVNAETGGITATQLTLGAATLTFNASTGALEVNF